jgi:hypothetical protein
MHPNYIFFLFCELARIKNTELKDIPYDIQFPVFMDLYNEYTQSPQSDQNKSEYDCILDFLTYKKAQKDKLTNELNSIVAEFLPIIESYDIEMIEAMQRALKRYNKKNLI